MSHSVVCKEYIISLVKQWPKSFFHQFGIFAYFVSVPLEAPLFEVFSCYWTNMSYQAKKEMFNYIINTPTKLDSFCFLEAEKNDLGHYCINLMILYSRIGQCWTFKWKLYHVYVINIYAIKPIYC